MNHSNRFYLGPPGTGKTYRCIRVAGWFIGRCHVKPIDIAYLSFTKIAASEAYKKNLMTYTMKLNLLILERCIQCV